MTTDWWEVMLRVGIIYLGVLILVRITGKRTLAQLGPMELLTTLIISETVSPALTAEDVSLTAALLAAATLFALTVLFAIGTYRLRWFERIVEGEPRPLIHDGVVDEKVQDGERITAQELLIALRENGIENVGKVRLAMVEPDGTISFITS
jgi:uncharacterized membrane protein YcaP (DUF421 family)